MRRRQFLLIGVLWTLAAGGVVGCTSSNDAAEPVTSAGSSPGAARSEETEAPGAPPDALATERPPEGGWLIDDRGRQYRIERLPKVEGAYRKVPGGRVRMPRGFTYDVAEEGEDYFLVKIYRVEDPPQSTAEPGRKPRGMGEPPPEGSLDRRMAQPSDLAEVDRLVLEPFDRGLPTAGQWRNGFTIVDFDGDGHLDIVHGPARKGFPTSWVFYGDGAGFWRAQSLRERLPRDLRLDYGDVTAADFNRDGRLDLAFAVHLRGVVVLVDDGEGGLRRWSEGIEYASIEGGGGPGGFTSRAIRSVDWDGDGWTDLVALGEGARMAMRREDVEYRRGSTDVVVFRNRGDGSWESVPLDRTRRLRGEALTVADINHDGRPDLLTGWMSSATPHPLVLNADADPTENGRAVIESLPHLEENTIIPAVSVADFDGDGRLDLAVAARGHRETGPWHGISVYLARDGGWEQRRVIELEGRRTFGALAAGRLPGDDRVDLVAFDDDGHGWIFLGDGEGGFLGEASPAMMAPDLGCAGYDAELVDLDGQPGDEIVASFAGEAGGEMLLDPTSSGRCRSGGRIAAWKARAR